MTPSELPQAHYPGPNHPTAPLYKHMGLSGLSQSPPTEDDMDPVVGSTEFRFSRPQSRGPPSRPSTASGPTPTDAADSDLEYETDSDSSSVSEVEHPSRLVVEGDFELEELDSSSDPGYASNIEVVLPTHYEEAKSEKGGSVDTHLLHKFRDMRCNGENLSSDEDEQERLYRRKKKRWSAGIFKRSHSQSIEGDSSYSDNDPLDDNDSTARRLRRRVRGPGDRTSLIFDDKGFPNTNNIAEVEEPEDNDIPHFQGPPSIPSDDGFTLDELPFWRVDDPMEFECESVL